jgi:hypothetical protein
MGGTGACILLSTTSYSDKGTIHETKMGNKNHFIDASPQINRYIDGQIKRAAR